jgi:WD40 repeat protein
VIFGLDRKGERSLHVKAGVSCFEISQKPSFLITGSTDGVIRLWNLDDERGLLFSADCSKIVMIWSVRTMQLVQSINLAKLIKSDSPISALFFSYKTKSAAIANENIHVLAPFKSNKNNVVMTSDDPVVAVLYNER